MKLLTTNPPHELATILSITICTLFLSCKNGLNNEPSESDTTAKLNYPFTPKYRVNWQQGDDQNAVIVLDCLKHYIAKDMKGAVKNFADTAEFISDQFYFKGKKDSLAATLATFLQGIKTEDIKIAPETFIASAAQTPCRMNIFNYKDFRFMIDFAHNPSGFNGINEFF